MPDLLGEIVLEAHLVDGGHLPVEPIEMRVDVPNHVFEQVTGREVADHGTVPHPVAQPPQQVLLGLAIEPKLLGNRLAQRHAGQAVHPGSAVEIENVADESVGIPHHREAAPSELVGEPFVAPVLAQLGLHEGLIDSQELGGQNLLQDLDHALVRLHGRGSSPDWPCPSRPGSHARAVHLPITKLIFHSTLTLSRTPRSTKPLDETSDRGSTPTR